MCISVWFKCQGVLTLSFLDTSTGCLSLSRKSVVALRADCWCIIMSSPPDPWCSPNESHGDKDEQEAVMTASGLAPHDRVHGLASLQTKVSSPPTDELWRQAFSHYGLERPTEVTEIYVFRVILQSSRDKNACTRSVTRAGPMSDPFQTLERIIDGWWDLEIEEHDQSWMLTPVNNACTWSLSNDFSYPVYVLTRKGNPFHLLRPHGVLEVVMGPSAVGNCHCLAQVDQQLSLSWSLCPGFVDQ